LELGEQFRAEADMAGAAPTGGSSVCTETVFGGIRCGLLLGKAKRLCLLLLLAEHLQ
jgi:hypothetical protein